MPSARTRLRQSERFRRYRRKRNEERFRSEICRTPVNSDINLLLDEFEQAAANADHWEFIQGYTELANNLRPAIARQPTLLAALTRLRNPEHFVHFDIVWTNEYGEEIVNQVWRCEYCSVLGPPRGGIRLHPTCNASIIKLLGLQQTFRNALLNMPMGGAATGSDFDAPHASAADLRSFAKAFIEELSKRMEKSTPLDIVADMGVGPREMAALNEAMNGSARKPITPEFVGKNWASGMGAVEFAKRFFKIPSFDKKRCIVSGSGNVALHVARNLIAEGAQVLTLSDTGGYVKQNEGLEFAEWQRIADLKHSHISLRDMIQEDGWLRKVTWHLGSVYEACIPADYAFACAYESEIGEIEALHLVKGFRIKGLVEVSNICSTPRATQILEDAGVTIVPNRGAGIGSITVIGLDMAETTPQHEYEHRLCVYTGYVHDQCRMIYDDFYPDLQFTGAVDICAFLRLATGMYDQGII